MKSRVTNFPRRSEKWVHAASLYDGFGENELGAALCRMVSVNGHFHEMYGMRSLPWGVKQGGTTVVNRP